MAMQIKFVTVDSCIVGKWSNADTCCNEHNIYPIIRFCQK